MGGNHISLSKREVMLYNMLLSGNKFSVFRIKLILVKFDSEHLV